MTWMMVVSVAWVLLALPAGLAMGHLMRRLDARWAERSPGARTSSLSDDRNEARSGADHLSR